MHSRSIISNYPSVKQLLHALLFNTLSETTQVEKKQFIEFKKNHLYKDRDNSKILYISGVAQQLSKSHNSTAMDIADSIRAKLSATSGDVCQVKIVPPGWIYLELTPPFLATWLQHLVMGCLEQDGKMGKEEINSQFKDHNPANIFAVQYSHARCCSLILLGHQEGLIQLREPLPYNHPAFGQLLPQQPIPWLNHDKQLCLNLSTEKDLLAQLVQVVDDLVCASTSDAINWQKAALKLSQALENFWCQCRIWGDVKIYSPELAQARLGLVIITQRLLRFLLVEKLGVTAPWEL
ncbi:DALR anticodon-binding domain-containing protein [Nostoc sp. PCC 7107]|nr:DALR anticodon-binding domain-containing protein [Nostoc sp. PCC 7107]